ncbi:hypothetical protein Dimus_011694 [Dionaea muscipula]
MDSDLQQHYQLQHFQDHHLNSRTRYRSAPSAYLDSIDAPSSVIVSNDKSDYNQPRPLSPETESIFAKFLSSVNDGNDNKLCGIPENYPVQAEYKEALVKQETQPINQHSSYPSPPPPVIYSPNKPPLAKNNLNHSPTSSNSSLDSTPFRAPSSMSMDQQALKMGAGGANGPNSNSLDASNNALTLLGPFRTPGSSMAMDSMPTPQIIRKIPGVGGGAGTSTSAPTPNPTMKSRCPFGAPGSMAMDSMPQQMKIGVGGMNGPMNQQQIKMGGGNGSHLVRHSSLPAGFLSDINLDHVSGFQSPSSGLADCRSFNNNNGTITNSKGSSSSSSSSNRKRFPISSWDDSMLLLSDYNLGNLEDDDDHKAFPDHELESSDHQNEAEAEATARINRPPTVLLAHHLSLPKTALEKVLTLQFQETTTPCQIRAKRGMATHPRSIAERVRRTRISERMRKLQDLVPYMDKQTNTADMLDLAVEYIKDLQKQVKILADKRAKCCCSG